MATGSSEKRRINFRLVHDGVQPGTPVVESLRFGLQDKNGEVHLGAMRAKGVQHFDLSLDVKEAGNSSLPDFGGAFVLGPPSRRFLYLSWKREGVHAAPWAWRIKMPLSGIGWADIRTAEKPNKCLAANVIGRRPHATEPIDWRLETLQKS
jgi:hypothetical protein